MFIYLECGAFIEESYSSAPRIDRDNDTNQYVVVVRGYSTLPHLPFLPSVSTLIIASKLYPDCFVVNRTTVHNDTMYCIIEILLIDYLIGRLV